MSTTTRWLLPVLVVVVALAVAGGVLARDFYQRERPVTTAVELPTSSALEPSEQPGSPKVNLTPDAAQHPYGETVRALLEAYTNGINERNYERWRTSVVQERVRKQPEDQWRRDYRSTRNGSMLVHRIESAPNGTLRMLVSFTSTQDVADAPPTLPQKCIRWSLMLPLAQENGQWKIDTVPRGAPFEYRKC